MGRDYSVGTHLPYAVVEVLRDIEVAGIVQSKANGAEQIGSDSRASVTQRPSLSSSGISADNAVRNTKK